MGLLGDSIVDAPPLDPPARYLEVHVAFLVHDLDIGVLVRAGLRVERLHEVALLAEDIVLHVFAREGRGVVDLLVLHMVVVIASEETAASCGDARLEILGERDLLMCAL